MLAAQIGAKFLLDKLLDDDGCRGDENGPFDAQTVRERRQELKEDKEDQHRRSQKKSSASIKVSDDGSDDNLGLAADEDDDWDLEEDEE